MAGLGLLLLSFVKQTRGPSDYWTTFLPGVLVFGLGMSFTVAPLTTAVMGSAGDHLSGTASGINNAMTRIANVFANAIFGALAVLFFSGALQERVHPPAFAAKDREVILAEAANLGDAKVPAQVPVAEKAVLQQFYHESFIDAYAKIMRISAGLAFLGALMTVLFVRRKT